MTINSMITIARISTLGNKPFYAKDVDMTGGLASHLSRKHVIAPTGNVREYTIPDPSNDRKLIKCEVNEWKANQEEIQRYMERCAEKIARTEAMLKEYHEAINALKT